MRTRDRLFAAAQRVVWTVGAVVLVIVLLRLMPLPLKHVFIIIFASILLAASISPAARFLSRYHVPRGVTVLLVYILGLAIIAGAMALLVPLIIDELKQFRSSLPVYASDIQNLVHRFAPSQSVNLSSSALIGRVSGSLSTIASSLTGVVRTIISIGIDVVLILASAFFMANDANFARKLIKRLVPPDQRPQAMRVMSRTGRELGEWVQGQLLLALYFGVVFGAGLYFIGIDYAVTLGAVGAILEIIPYVGGFLTMVLAVLVGLTHDPLHAALALGWYAIVAETEAHIVHPKLMQHFVRLNPVAIILALFLGGEAFGLIGALLAVPIAVVVKVLVDEFYQFEEKEEGANPGNTGAVAGAKAVPADGSSDGSPKPPAPVR